MKTQQQLEEKAGDVALGHYLSDYPANIPFGDVLDLIMDGDDSVIVWSPFEYEDRNELIDLILGMKKYILSEFRWVQEVK